MAKTLLEKVIAIRRRVVVLVWANAVCRFLAMLIAALLVAVWCDGTVRSDSTTWRLLLGVTLLLASLIAAGRWLIPAWNYYPDGIQVARRLERSQGGWQDELSTAVQLAQQQVGRDTQPTQMQSQLMANALQRLQPFSLGSLVTIDNLVRPVAWLLLAVALAAGLIAAQRDQVWFSLQRITQPWVALRWPRVNQLQLEPIPRQVARGDDVLLMVTDGHRLLTHGVVAEIQTGEAYFAMDLLPRSEGESTFLGQLSDLQTDTRVRIRGGDDQTDWHEIRVVDPPRLISLDIRWQHPQILNGQPQPLGDAGLCWPGSELLLQGQTNQPLATATLVQQFPDGLQKTRLDITQDKYVFSTGTTRPTLPAAAKCWLELRTTDGIESWDPESWEMRLMTDRTPQVQLTTGDEIAGLQSAVPLGVSVQDELPIQECTLSVFGRDGPAGPSLKQTQVSLERTESVSSAPWLRSYLAETVLDVDTLNGLRVGDRLQVTATAKDVPGQGTVSQPLTIQLVSQQVLTETLQQKVNRLVERLREIQVQQTVLSHAFQPNQLPVDKDRRTTLFRSLSHEQRRVLAMLQQAENTPGSLTREISEFSARHRIVWRGQSKFEQASMILGSTTTRIAMQLGSQLDRLTTAIRVLADSSDGWRSPWEDFHVTQQALLTDLDRVIRLLESGREDIQIVSLAKRIRQQLLQVLEATETIHQENLTPAGPPNPTRLDQLLLGQSRVRADTETLVIRLQQATQDPQSSDPRFAGALELINQNRLISVLLEAETALTRQQTGQTLQHQQQALRAFDQLILALDSDSQTALSPASTETSLEDTLDQLTEAFLDYNRQLNSLIESQRLLTSPQRHRLDGRKRELQQELSGLRDALRSSSFGELDQMLQQAEQIVEDSTSGGTPQQLAAEASSIDQVIDQLRWAALEMARQQQNAEAGLDLSQIWNVLHHIKQIQSRINQECESNRKALPQISDRQWEALANLQRQLWQSFQLTRTHLSRYPTAVILTDSLNGRFQESADRIASRRLDPITTRLQQRILAELEQLILAIEIQLASNRQATEVQSEPSEANPVDQVGISAFELTMLYVLQKDIQRETEQWNADLAEQGGVETAALAEERQELARRQQEVALVLESLLQTAGDAIPQLPDF